MKFRLVFPLAALLIVPPLVAQPAALRPRPRRPRATASSRPRRSSTRPRPIRLAPDLSHLTPAERQAVAKLLEVGAIFQDLYEQQRHRDMRSPSGRAARRAAPTAPGRALYTLYRLFQGPIATTLDNQREPFLAVADAPPGKNVYPWDLTKAEFDAFLAAHPDARARLTHLRSVVRRADAAEPRAPTSPTLRATSGARHAASRPARAARGSWRGGRTGARSTPCLIRSLMPTR